MSKAEGELIMYSLIPKKAIKVKRTPRATFVDGFPVAPVVSEFEVKASVQPAQERDLKTLPEGTHYVEGYVLYSHDYLQEEDSQYEADVVTIGTRNFKVMKVSDWDNTLLPHRKILVIR